MKKPTQEAQVLLKNVLDAFFNSKLDKNLGQIKNEMDKIKMKGLDPCMIQEEVAPRKFIIKHLYRFILPQAINGSRMKPYYFTHPNKVNLTQVIATYYVKG